jgi:hypothetical protein
MDKDKRKPLWQAPRIVVQGHVSEIVATDGTGKICYGPDADNEVGKGTCT